MTVSRTIVFALYDGFELLDMAGPISVFTTAARLQSEVRYSVVLGSSQGGEVMSDGGIVVIARALSEISATPDDILLIPGAMETGLSAALSDPVFRECLTRIAGSVGRVASVCTGAFILAALGLADGAEMTTHWRAGKELQDRHPELRVNTDALFIDNGTVWSSAGVSTGIDMALAMIERDLGTETTLNVARELVVYAQRPGDQSQFSALLEHQAATPGAMADTLAWIERNLDGTITVAAMAEQAGLSERTLLRRFSDAVGQSPKAYVTRLRLDHARRHLASGAPVSIVAMRVGFNTALGLTKAFEKHFGVTPAQYRRLHLRR